MPFPCWSGIALLLQLRWVSPHVEIQRQRICMIADSKIVNWTYILTEQAKQTHEDFVSIILRYSGACLEEKQRMKHSTLSKKICTNLPKIWKYTPVPKIALDIFSVFFFFFFNYYHVISIYQFGKLDVILALF